MDKKAITELLEQKHQELFMWLENEPEEKWMQGPEGKWTAGQHAQHLLNSLQLLNHAMSFPNFLLKYKYGSANRPLRSYEAVAKRYEEKLAANLDRAEKFNRTLKVPPIAKKDAIITSLKIQNKKLQHKTLKWKDKNLDKLILPHPLMGKMPVRELIMWTAHHTEHHLHSLKSNY